jgi:hypothetical protein
MPDLFAHALVAYAGARLLSLRVDWLDRPYVTAAMAGAFVPDVMKVRILVGDGTVGRWLGLPFEWAGLQTGGAAVLFVLVGAMVVVPRVRTRATLALGFGAVTHLVADALLRFPTGRAHPVFWPVTRWSPPAGGLGLSSDPVTTAAAAVLAVAAHVAWRRATEADRSADPAGSR